jgi:hypothetical protein
VLAKLVIVPLVIVAAVEVVVPAVRVGIVPSVIFAVLEVRLAIVPVVLLNVAMVPVVLLSDRLDVGTASATRALSLAAVTSLVTPSENEVPAVKFAIVLSPYQLKRFFKTSHAIEQASPTTPATAKTFVFKVSSAPNLLAVSP